MGVVARALADVASVLVRITLIPLAFLLVAADEAPLDVQADRMELTQKTGLVRFEGNVRATQDALTLRCDRLVARSKDGEVVQLTAEGSVAVASEDLRATAKKVVWQRSAGTLVFTGSPRVTRGDDVLAGERIVLYPDEGRLVVERARGRLGKVPRIAVKAPK